MRPLIVNAFMTLDGVMQAPGGPEEDPSGGFTQGGWSVTYWDDVMGQKMGESFRRPFDLLLGRKTYEIFAAHWPHASSCTSSGSARTSSVASGVSVRASSASARTSSVSARTSGDNARTSPTPLLS